MPKHTEIARTVTARVRHGDYRLRGLPRTRCWSIDLECYGNGSDVYVDYLRVYKGGD